MDIVVTGGAGFIGREVVRQLLQKKHRVRVVDNLGKKGSAVPEGAEFVRADLRHSRAARDAFAGFEACVNLAARIGGIAYFHKYPADILSENNLIYSNTFAAAVAARHRRMIMISSSMVYESARQFPVKEEDLASIAMPRTAYGFSKLIGEMYCRAFYDQYRLSYTILRPFNAYGPHEEPGDEVGESHVIPDLIHKIHVKKQNPVEILGDGSQTRCFTFVSDIARAVVMALESSAAENQDFNVGTMEETSIRRLAEKLFALCRPGERLQLKSMPPLRDDVRRRVPDTSKIARVLNWKPLVSLNDGLQQTVRWFQEQYGG